MKPWMVFDAETDAFDGQPVSPFIWGWMDHEGNYEHTYSTSHFLAVLSEFDGIALAHNGGKFDILFFAEAFNIGDEIKIINGRVAEVKIGRCLVRDSFLIIPSPLASSGEKEEFDYGILDRNKKHLRKKHKSEIEHYLKQDCIALHKLVDRFYQSHGQRLTQAGAALAYWEKMGGLVRRWGGAHDAVFRSFYYGGRNEAKQKGVLGNDWLYFDIKSSYPYAMTLEHTASHISDYRMHAKINQITPQSFARIVASNRGCLPVRGKYETEYPYHDDPREYFATGWEILAGLQTNTLKVFEATIYEPYELETLAPYVHQFYADKANAEKNGDSVGRLIAKIFMNSLYGKFGQNAAEFHKYRIVAINDRPDGYETYLEYDSFDIVKKLSGGQFFDVALSASITGCARARLFEQMTRAEDLAYLDTDSIICRGGDFDVGENLGQWELQHTLDDLHIAGKKLYAGRDRRTGEWITAHKGFSKLDVDAEHIIRVTRGEQLEITHSAPTINLFGQQNFIRRTMKRT